MPYLVKKSGDYHFPGNSSSRRLGGGLGEFYGHRPYHPGDDLRYLDWRLYGRSGELAVKKFSTTGGFGLLLVIDRSASMSIGTPAKLALALQIAAAFVYVGIHTGCKTQIALLGQTRIEVSRPFAQPAHFYEALAYLSQVKPQGKADWQALATYLSEHATARVVVCSDLLAIEQPRFIADPARDNRSAPAIFHVLADEELQPPSLGVVSLCDAETQERRPYLLNTAGSVSYRRHLETYLQRWRQRCASSHIPYFLAVPSMPFLSLVQNGMVALGWR